MTGSIEVARREMESMLAGAETTKARTIEYPSDLTGCSVLSFEGRQLLCINPREDRMPFIVVLGFLSGQKQDFVAKILIEPVPLENGAPVEQSVKEAFTQQCGRVQVFFI